MAIQRLNLTRDQFASFLKDFEQIKQFERLFSTVDTINTVTLDEINVSAGTALAAANDALAQISGLSSQTDFLAFAPPDLGGTVTSVGLSGGTTGLTVSGTNPITTSGTFTLGGTLVAVNGGTGFASYAVGDMLYASTTTALSKLADVATGNVLLSGGVGVAPAYGKVGLTTHVSGTLPVANGGTNSTATATAGGVAYGTGVAITVNAAGPAGYVLTSGGAAPPIWTPVAALAVGTSAYWGSFWDTTTQTAPAPNTAYILTLNSADPTNNGVSVVSGSRVTFTHAGVYSLTFSIQFENGDNANAAHEVNVWLRKNDSGSAGDVPDSDSKFTVPPKHAGVKGSLIGTVNFVLTLAAGDFIELVYAVSDVAVLVASLPAGTSPVSPRVPSIIFTAVAAAPVGLGYAGVESVTSLTIGTGSKTFTVNTNATDTAFIVGNRVRLVNSSTNYMDGVITAYSGTSMTVLVDGTAGSGTYTAWFVTLTGSVGGVTSFSGNSTGLTPATPTVGAISLAGTLNVANGGTGQTSYTNGQLLIGNTTGNTLAKATLTAGTNVSITNGAGAITINATDQFTGTVTSVSGTGTVSGITLTGTVTTTGSLTLGGTLAVTASNFASQTANTFLAAPNGLAGVPTFRAVVAADIPTLNQNTTGTASNITGTVAIANGGTGAITAPLARTALGATTVGSNVFTLTNPSAITFPRFNADNTVSALDAATFRTAIGAGTGSGTVTSVSGTGTVNGITLTGTVTSSGSLTLGGTLSGVSLTTQVSGTLPAANGGTGQSAYTVGDLLFASTTSALSKLADVATGNALISGGVGIAPSYGKIGLTTHVSGTLAVANGGTGVTSSTGTVAVVLSNTPTLVTPILGDATATTIANGLGTVGNPSFTFTGDLNTGMWSPAADTTAFSTAGIERARIDNSGNFGVGTTSPTTGSISNTAILNAGLFTTLKGSVSSGSGVVTTLTTVPTSSIAVYVVSCGASGASDPTNYTAVALVSVDSTVLRLTSLQTAPNMIISVSGQNIRAAQSSGITLTILYSLTRIA
jgi:hypothetical protein